MTREVRRYDRPDGKQIVRVVELEGGLFTFTVETELWEEAHPAIGEGYAYCGAEIRGDGVFETLPTAEREVAARFPWISSPGL